MRYVDPENEQSKGLAEGFASAYVGAMGFLSKLKKNLAGDATRVNVPPHRVGHPHYVIGDIHGCMDLLMNLCDLIEHDVTTRPEMAAAKVVYLGDYVDRGDQSAAVLQHLFDLTLAQPDRHICLAGNHEAMMLNFLDDPVQHGGRWLRYGGMQTLASFGLRGLRERMPSEDMPAVARDLEAAMPAGMDAWLRGLRKIYQTGNIVCVHAALNPARPWDDQSDRARLWGHKDFFTQPRTDGMWVVHGHTIVDQPQIKNGIISLDTGAYATGRLTALCISGDQSRLLGT